ncbi:MAG: SDR family oxidoreductase [Deltaproteobacteria bacterium]|nr:SDR family oxidoreductase [Deltaproteobacteria bacterium]
MSKFVGKRIWITGASSGIGEALALRLDELGASLILSSRDSEKLNGVLNSCKNPERHKILLLDLEKYPELPKIAEDAWRNYGPIDILVNNAGISQRYLVCDGNIDLDAKIMNVNFFGTIALTRPILRKMLEVNSGQVAVVSSVLGLFGIQSRSAYSASKHALRGYFESLRNEIAKSPVKITMIYPGYVKTNVSRNALTADGGSYGVVDKQHNNAMSAMQCAEEIIIALGQKKPDVVFGGRLEMLSVAVAKYMPRIFRTLSTRINV